VLQRPKPYKAAPVCCGAWIIIMASAGWVGACPN
jgi:hypothetical protein